MLVSLLSMVVTLTMSSAAMTRNDRRSRVVTNPRKPGDYVLEWWLPMMLSGTP